MSEPIGRVEVGESDRDQYRSWVCVRREGCGGIVAQFYGDNAATTAKWFVQFWNAWIQAMKEFQ